MSRWREGFAERVLEKVGAHLTVDLALGRVDGRKDREILLEVVGYNWRCGCGEGVGDVGVVLFGPGKTVVEDGDVETGVAKAMVRT